MELQYLSEFTAQEQATKDYLALAAEQLKEAEIRSTSHVLSARDYKAADYSYEIIMQYIKRFEDSLDAEHEVAVMLASFGQNITMAVTNIGYANPNILTFHGYVADQPATLIQHMSQLNFLLLAARKSDPEKPPRRIGFAVPTED